ncbi:MAG: PAS domain S-box protein, partial [Anaerolineae bacterium]|nr:PAS domain S-box protein [Anaerolineae bacterium]
KGPRWARTDKLPLTGQQGEIVGLVGISVDITDQVLAEQSLEAERRFVADLLNVVPIGICVNDEEGRYVLVNDAYCEIYNFRREEIIGQHFSAITPPDQVDLAKAHYAQMLAGDLGVPVERKRQRSDGTIVYIEAANGVLVRRDGRKYVTTVVRDITPRKEVEVEREQLIQDLNAYGHMVAHDLKNPLAVVLGFADVMRADGKSMSDADFEISLSAIESSAHKMAAIIDELMLLAHVSRQDVASQPVDMGLVVQAAQERLSWMIVSANPEIIVPGDWPVVCGYAPWLEEVWTNYISNAIKYGGSPPRIELGATPLEKTVRFWVRDNGVGIPADQLDKLFTPFTRLEQVRKVEGHGLGLSIVQRIVEQLGGEVGVESQEGQGSTFTFTLPRATNSSS